MTQNVEILWIATKGLLKGREFPMLQNELTFGRVHQNQVVMPEHPISRNHAKAFLKQDALWLIDLGSKNGTVVNGKKIAANEEIRLSHKDEIQMGTTVFEVHLIEKTQREVPADTFTKAPSFSPPEKKEKQSFTLPPINFKNKRVIMYGAVGIVFLFMITSSKQKNTPKNVEEAIQKERIQIPTQLSIDQSQAQKIPTLEEIDPLIAQAESAMRFEDYHKAIRIFESILKVRPEDEKVIAYYDTAKTNLYRKIQKHQDIAKIEFEKLNYEAAKEQWQRILELTEGFDPVLYQQTLDQVQSMQSRP